MRWGILLLTVLLLGCDPTRTGGPPISTTVYPIPRRASWGEEVQLSLPWRAGDRLQIRLAGLVVGPERSLPEGDGSRVVFKVPTNLWGGPQALEIVDGANRASGSLVVLGQGVAQAELEALAVIRPGVAESTFEQVLSGKGLRLLPNPKGEKSVPLGASQGPCAGRLARVGRNPSDPSPLPIGALLERLEEVAGGQVVDLDGVLGIDPLTGYDADPAPSPNSSPINARSAVKVRQGSNFTGAGTTIAIVDTGVKNLTGLTLRPGGADFVNPDAPNPLLDDYTQGGEAVGHGTAVAVLAAHPSYGIAPATGILPIKSCDKDGRCPLAAVIQGICHAVAYAEKNPSQKVVINLSLGSDTPSEILYIVLKDALMKRGVNGVPVVAAAGNQWAIRSSRAGVLHHFPASFGGNRGLSVRREPGRSMTLLKGLVSVGSVGLYGGAFRVSGFSGQGDFLDLVAAGERVLSLRPDGAEAQFTGTSFAAPIVAAAAAILRQASPFAPLSPEALEVVLRGLTDEAAVGEVGEEARGQGMLDLSGGP